MIEKIFAVFTHFDLAVVVQLHVSFFHDTLLFIREVSFPLPKGKRGSAAVSYTHLVCGGKTEVYSRITGYYRPVQNWNDGKRCV